MTYTIVEDYTLEEDVANIPHSFSLDMLLRREYRTFQKSTFEVETVMCLFVLQATFYVSGTNIFYALTSGFQFKLNMITTVMSFILYLLLSSGYLIQLFTKDKSSRLCRLSNYFVTTFLDGNLGDVIAILFSFGVGAKLYARARAGMCPIDVTLGKSLLFLSTT
jgi:hypothetical protein